jgi:ubiquinone/menaquinone biosynthesis C-methylase UbiE
MITVDLSRLNIKPGDRILDIGCGSGRHTAAAYEWPKVWVIGVDRNPADLNQARKRLGLHDRMDAHGSGRWALFAADITALPLRDNIFDGVICSEVLEHIPNHHLAVREILRVLKPGHFLAVSVPRFWPEKICWLLSEAYHQASGGHVRIYRQAMLKHLVETAGAKRRSAHWAHSLHTPFWWLKCLVGPSREDHPLVNTYHRFLTWDIMKKPKITRTIEKILNPFLGKSLVMYFRKDG